MVLEHFYKSVVSINIFNSQTQTYLTVGSGFFIIYKNQFYLITNKHVIKSLSRFNINFSNSDDYNMRHIEIKNSVSALFKKIPHPDNSVDLVAFWIDRKLMSNYDIGIDIEKEALTIEMLKQNNVAEGAKVFTIGHPMNITSRLRLYPLVRQGIISQIRKMYELDYAHKHIIIDSFAFPGNSGGPAILHRQNVFTNKLINKNFLIGVTTGGFHSKQNDLETTQNLGITAVIAVDHILECLKGE